jgi:hypothetical protein
MQKGYHKNDRKYDKFKIIAKTLFKSNNITKLQQKRWQQG